MANEVTPDWADPLTLPEQPRTDIPKGVPGAPKVGEQAPGGGRYAGIVSGERRDAHERIVQSWVDKAGVPRHVAEGIADRAVGVESGGDPTAIGDKGTSGGLYQEHGPRWDRLKAFADRQGKPWTDFDVQNDYAIWEAQSGDPQAAKHWDEIKNAPDRKTANQLFTKYFERPAGGGWADPITASGKWRVGDKALAYEQGRSNTSVVWMSPDDYLGMVPESADKDKRKSLLKSLNAGDEIESIPSLDATVKDGRLKIIDQDGQNRARVAKEEGVELIPVAVHGATGNAAWIEDMNGAVRPFDFTPVPKATPPAPTRAERFGMGVADVGYGAAQLGGHISAVPEEGLVGGFGMVPPEAARTVDQIVAQREQGIQAERAARGETGTDWLRTGGNILGSAVMTAPLMAVPGVGAVSAGASTLGRIGGAALGGALAGGSGAALEPVTSGEYVPQKAAQIGEGATIGAALPGGASAVGQLVRSGVNAIRRIVSPKTITEAASRLFGENTKTLTESKIIAIKDRLAATFERIEKSHDIDISRDPKLVSELDLAKQEARTTLGDPNYGGRAGPILAAVDKFLSLADDNGVIPGKSAATLWHEGGAVDRLTKNADPSIRQFGQQLKTTARDAFSRVLPPDDAAVYSATRRQWRDMKIVEKAIPTGQHEVRPRQFVQRVRQRFPNEKEMRTPPEVVKLARAVGETWPMGDTSALAARTAARTVRAIAAGGLGHLVGGPIGGGIGVAGELAMERLMRDRRIASRNAMLAFRPPAPAQPPSNAMRVLRPVIQRAPNAFAAPLGAAVAAP